MRFPRNLKIFRGHLDAAPIASVFFILLAFLVYRSDLVTVPGIPINLPEAGIWQGSSGVTVAVTLDTDGSYYYDQQLTRAHDLKTKLRSERLKREVPLTLVIQSDRNVEYFKLVGLVELARDAGIESVVLATRPRIQLVPGASGAAP